MQLQWHEEFDDENNSIWVADSAYTDDSGNLVWRLTQVIHHNGIWWTTCESDFGLNCGHLADYPRYPQLEDAKQACQKANDIIASDCKNV